MSISNFLNTFHNTYAMNQYVNILKEKAYDSSTRKRVKRNMICMNQILKLLFVLFIFKILIHRLDSNSKEEVSDLYTHELTVKKN